MPNFICMTCGVQYDDTKEPHAVCPICQDERQYIGLEGQKWTTLDDMRTRHHNRFLEEEPGLWGIRTEPQFAIGQVARLIPTPRGNVLWECISLVDQPTIDVINA